MLHIGHVFNQIDAIVQLPHGAFNLGVAFVTDHHKLIAFFGQLGHLDVHLGYQRASGIKHLEATRLRFQAHRLAHAMGAEHQRGTRRHIGQVFDEDGTLCLEVVDHIGVVHNFVAHVDGRTKALQGPFDNFNGPVNPGAEAAGFGQQDFFDGHVYSTPKSLTSKRTGCPANGWLKSNRSQSGPHSRTRPA